MFKSLLTISLLSLLAVASPQYGAPPGGNSPASSSSSPSSAAAAVPSAPPSTQGQINVDVAPGGQFVFNPANINATAGTLITFFFPSGSTPHSVTQSTFSDPCTPLTGNGTGFDSGLTNSKQFTLNVTDASTPIWFFCKTPLHCGGGMVGSINAPASGNTFDSFMSKAKAIGNSETTVPDNGPVTGGVGAVATAGPAAGSALSSSGAPAPTTSGSSSSGAGHLAVSGALGLVAAFAAFALSA